MSNTKKCIFCQLINQNDESVLYQDDDVAIIADIRPLNTGHVLVMPTDHIENMVDVPEHQNGFIWQKTLEAAKKIRNLKNVGGYNILLNTGEDAGQEIPHAHLHVIPRINNDSLRVFSHASHKPRDLELLKTLF